MRSQLRIVDQDQAGNVRPTRSIEVFDYGTTTPISNPLYPSATSVVTLNPNTLTTNTLGEFEAWIDGLSAPVDIRIGGATGVTETVYFVPDPATLALAADLPAAILTTQGDIIVGGVGGDPGRLGIGTARQNLQVNSGATGLQYVASLQSLIQAAGDLIQGSGANTPARLGIGTAFQELVVNSGATAVQWASGLLARVQAAGDIVQGTGPNAVARLAIGTARQTLAVNPGATALEYVESIQSLITAAGDLIVGSGANAAARLAKGANGTYLGVVAGTVTWTTGSQVPDVRQLNYTAATDVASAVAMTLNVQADVNSNQSFSVADAASIVEIEVRGTANVTSPTNTAQVGARILIDGTTGYFLGGTLIPAANAYVNALSGADTVSITGLSVGSHTVRVQAICSANAALYCRASTFPNFEGLSIVITERKG